MTSGSKFIILSSEFGWDVTGSLNAALFDLDTCELGRQVSPLSAPPLPPPAIYLVCGFETKTVNHIGRWKNEKHVVVVSVLKQF